jgi:signal transduction histidine kinase
MYKKTAKPTLLSRVHQHSLWLAGILFSLFSLLTIFIVFALEDAFLKDQLQQTYQSLQQGHVLPKHYRLITDTENFQITDAEQLKYFEFDDNSGEFEQSGQHFHFLKTDLGILLLNSSKVSFVNRAIDDILLLLLVMLIPTLIITLWLSGKLAHQALKPFTLMQQALTTNEPNTNQLKTVVANIQEQDLQAIANQLIHALQQQQQALHAHITFNQGMAHEIRTPLQVMSHSMELINVSLPQAAELASYRRLDKALIRMNRISTALLWLTSDAQEAHATNASDIIQTMLKESEPLIQAHSLDIHLTQHPTTLELPVPAEVLELVVLNLLTNVIHHGQSVDGHIAWHIDIQPTQVRFSNSFSDSLDDPVGSSAGQPEPGEATIAATKTASFGLGLQLVVALMQRFDVACEIHNSNNEFSVTLSSKPYQPST